VPVPVEMCSSSKYFFSLTQIDINSLLVLSNTPPPLSNVAVLNSCHISRLNRNHIVTVNGRCIYSQVQGMGEQVRSLTFLDCGGHNPRGRLALT
jgi:hypothetical protein